MKLFLKEDWDIPIQIPLTKNNVGYFIGRKKELFSLFNELSRRKTGSILISGYRGVGKTSLVYKVTQ